MKKIILFFSFIIILSISINPVYGKNLPNDSILIISFKDKFGQTIKEDMLEGKTLSTFDFGIFTVYVNYEESDRIRYKIIPSKEMNNVVKGTINGKLNLLDDKLSSNLAEKFMNVYKDIC